MKKSLKIVLAILLMGMLFFAVAQPTVFADSVAGVNISKGQTNNVDTNGSLASVAQSVINYIWYASIIIAVIVVMYIGIKYIVGSASERAEYKKTFVPLIVGVVILVFATSIVNFLFSLG